MFRTQNMSSKYEGSKLSQTKVPLSSETKDKFSLKIVDKQPMLSQSDYYKKNQRKG